MAIQTTGPLSLANIQTEFGGGNPISISEYYRGGGYVSTNNTSVPTSGTISLQQFRGAVRQLVLDITGTESYVNLRDFAISSGWNGSDNILFIINGTANVVSYGTNIAALTISGSFPNGVIVRNYGYIVGMGGAGGNYDQPGLPGGPALSVSTPVTFENYGVIAGGGGGGGAGAYWAWNGYDRSTPGSGGASSAAPAAGGTTWGSPSVNGYQSGGPDSRGLYSGGGASNNWSWGGRASSPGGVGGSWGVAGDAGGGPDGAYNYTGFAGGAGGASVIGNGYITWLVTGIRQGSIG